METQEFIQFWKSTYPEIPPIAHELKWAYPDRWLRIHSLPASKRYAETPQEHEIILGRQRQVFFDVFGHNCPMIICAGLFISPENYEDAKAKKLERHGFTNVDKINLHKKMPEEYDQGLEYAVYIKADRWQKDSHAELLKNIASGETKAMFISSEKNSIMAPYEGGVDIIAPDLSMREKLKVKYKDWLSAREDGL